MNTQSIDEMKYVSIEGRDCPLNETNDHVMYKGEWLEIHQDQEGYSYIWAHQRPQAIYIDEPSTELADYPPTPVSIDKEVLLMTKGEWFTSTDKKGDFTQIKAVPNKFILECDGRFETYTNEANAKAICTAVNESYGKGYRPESLEELYKALERIIDRIKENGLQSNFPSAFERGEKYYLNLNYKIKKP